MKIAVLSDIHANRLAFQAVLEDSLNWEVDRYWFLGDAVGYGTDPIEPLLWIKHYLDPEDWVIGNHDAMLANLLSADEWSNVNESPKVAVQFNRVTLASEQNHEANNFWQQEFRLERSFPRQHRIDGLDYLLIHGSQVSPLFRYIYPWQTEIFLLAEFEALQTRYQANGFPIVQCFGHTHIPTLVFARPVEDDGFLIEPVYVIPNQPYQLGKNLTLINPGSVGQPRDLDRRAAYAILDTDQQTITFRRVPYDWQAKIYKLIQANYTESLIRRLRDAPPPQTTPDSWLDHFRLVAGISQ